MGSLPNGQAVSNFLSTALFRDVAVTEGVMTPVSARSPCAGALYKSLGGRTTVLVADAALAAAAGAALAGFPPNRAEQCARMGFLDEALQEVVREVMNVCARLFDTPGAPQVLIQDVYFAPPGLPAPVHTFIATAKERKSFTVAVSGYPKGRLALYG